MLEKLLGLESRNMLDNPSVNLNDPSAYDFLTSSYQTDAGINVGPRAALRLPPVWQAVNQISGGIMVIPLDAYRKDAKLGRVVASDHPAHRLIHEQASDDVTSPDLWQTAMVHALIWNNAFIWIQRRGDGTPIGLYNLLPDRTAPEIINGQLSYMTETTRKDGSPWLRPLPASDVIHIRGISFDGICGLDIVEHARHSWALALAHQKFEAKLFKNGVRAGGILEIPANFTAKAANTLEEGFRKKTGENEWFKTVIVRDGAKFHQQTFDPQSAQIVELGEAKVRDLARWFNLAPSRLGISDSVSYNSKSEDKQSFLDDTLQPWLIKIAAQCKMRLLTPADIKSGIYIEHNTSVFLRMNLKDRYTAYGMGYGRWLNRNDIRSFENMPDTGEEGNKFVEVPVIGNTTGGADKSGNDKPRGPGKRSKRPRPTPNHNTIAIRRIVFNLADHARKKSANPKAFIEFVDGNLAFHRTRAESIDGADEWINRAAAMLKTVVESRSAAELENAVDAAMFELESSCP